MSRLCGGAHEISGIKAPLFLHGWVVGGFLGWVGGGRVGRDGWVGQWWLGDGVGVVVGLVVGWVEWMVVRWAGWCDGEGG